MKTRDAPPEKGRAKAEGSAAVNPEMARFKALAKKVVGADKGAVQRAEEQAKKKRG